MMNSPTTIAINTLTAAAEPYNDADPNMNCVTKHVIEGTVEQPTVVDSMIPYTRSAPIVRNSIATISTGNTNGNVM